MVTKIDYEHAAAAGGAVARPAGGSPASLLSPSPHQLRAAVGGGMTNAHAVMAAAARLSPPETAVGGIGDGLLGAPSLDRHSSEVSSHLLHHATGPGAAAATATAGLFAKARQAQLEAAHAEKEYLRAKKEAAEMAARIAQQEFLLARHQLQRIEAQKVAAFVAGDINAGGINSSHQLSPVASSIMDRAAVLPYSTAAAAHQAPMPQVRVFGFPPAPDAQPIVDPNSSPKPEDVPSYMNPTALAKEDLLRSLNRKRALDAAAAATIPVLSAKMSTSPTAIGAAGGIPKSLFGAVGPEAVAAAATAPPAKKARKQLDIDARDERLKDLFMPKYPLTAYNFFFSVEREKILSALSKPELSSEELDNAVDDAARERAIADLLSRSASDAEHEEFEKGWTDRMCRDQLGRYDPDKKRKRLHRKTHGKVGFVHLARIISSRWRALPTNRVKFYRDLAEADMARWKEATKEYRRNKALVEMGLAPEKTAIMAGGVQEKA